MITREQLENNQVWLYMLTLVIAVGFGLIWTDFSSSLVKGISVVLGILMYGMFSQIPFFRLKEALSNRRFIYALLTVNYVAIPILVWLLTRFLPDSPPLLLGVFLVLLTPCIDYVIVFTYLGRGNEKLMLVATPLLFVTQMLLLPLYLWLFMGEEAATLVHVEPFVEAFLSLIVLPLVIALAVQLLAKRGRLGQQLMDGSAWLPVPFMALTLFVIVASQIGKLSASLDMIIYVVPVYVAFMLITPVLSRFFARVFQLDIEAGRALIFSGGTRNSLVVLPFALALPADTSLIVTSVIVTQTLVEIIGELVYIRFVPNVILKDTD
ncbi:arsenic resistance protein [Brevibacillus reuszeri]|uniref:Arsenic resistance protein n=1 Tax=Brevibacillus reuszeri TaxID=54915 RepID=A0A0K9YNI4_9BACL|nr:arsenic resistance protein [Brevibacillus reuszeri]KNB70298.1 arsenic resistance protein [Brevibacillus reuszeri]MED1859261.1 arsenic resistance protein [Brevibacillus reuszeri]GED72243.1 arsenic resistance protein [Brevibacillus reuszeri]